MGIEHVKRLLASLILVVMTINFFKMHIDKAFQKQLRLENLFCLICNVSTVFQYKTKYSFVYLRVSSNSGHIPDKTTIRMKIFKNLFRSKMPEKIHERFPENSKGDFYVENQVCITCRAPEAEAPDLIEHSKFEYGHCYFKKQPQTPDELDRAISAMQVSCIAGIRYSGKDEAVLKRLYKLGLENECDHKPG